MHSHYSFDIFDTVLTRRLSRPVDAFTLLGERLQQEGIRVPPFGLFRLLRMRCERWSRRFEPSYEVRLTDVHRLLGKFLLWSEKDQLRAAELEREVEASVLRITPHGQRAIKKARETEARIAYVSDMYLEEDFLKSILKREGLFEDFDLLAVSGEWKVSKAGGTIWPRVIETLGVSAADILHQGDNPHSDIESPRKHGISSSRLGTAEVSRWEEPDKGDKAKVLEEFGGIAALSRLARSSCAEPDDYWTCLGTGVLGPILAGFTRWLLEDAKRRGIGTLWFLSRDGWLFLESARLMAGEQAPELEYFCAGRRQLLLATLEPLDVSLESLFRGSRHHSLRLVASRLSLGDQELEALLNDPGLGIAGLDCPLAESTKRCLTELLGSAEWRERLVHCREAAVKPIMGYLEQMRSRVKAAAAVVDVGWQGRSQDHLDALLPDLGELRGYYLGYSGEGAVSVSKSGWIYDRSRGKGSSTLYNHQRLFEVLIGGVSGPLSGYEKGNEGWEPVFEGEESGEHAPGRERAQKAALEFVRVAADPTYSDWSSPDSLLGFSNRNLDRLFLRPTAEDARFFQSWKGTTDDAHQDSVSLAEGYDLGKIRNCLLGKEPWAFLWPAAALRNSTRFGRFAMRAARLLLKLRK
jgi:FMN phosphatase YigB (HAD superfamily)